MTDKNPETPSMEAPSLIDDLEFDARWHDIVTPHDVSSDELKDSAQLERAAAARIAELEQANAALQREREKTWLKAVTLQNWHCESDGCIGNEAALNEAASHWVDRYHAVMDRASAAESQVALLRKALEELYDACVAHNVANGRLMIDRHAMDAARDAPKGKGNG